MIKWIIQIFYGLWSLLKLWITFGWFLQISHKINNSMEVQSYVDFGLEIVPNDERIKMFIYIIEHDISNLKDQLKDFKTQIQIKHAS